jgi:hypothetical protein
MEGISTIVILMRAGRSVMTDDAKSIQSHLISSYHLKKGFIIVPPFLLASVGLLLSLLAPPLAAALLAVERLTLSAFRVGLGSRYPISSVSELFPLLSLE